MKDKFNKIDKILLFITIILTVFGLVMIFSSSSIAAVLQYGNTEYYFFKKQLIVVIAGLFISFILFFIPTEKYKELSIIGIVAIIIALIALKTYGTVFNNAKSWFRVLGFSIQPSEFAKTFIILFLACAYGSKKKFETIYNLFFPLVPCIGVFILVCLEPDLGTAAIIAIICMFIFFSLPVGKNKTLNILKAGVIIVILLAVLFLQTNQNYLTNSQSSRFNYKNPCKRYLEETGYQVCNGYIAIHNGGIWGVGLGKSTQKYLYLPEAYTDFIFPIIVEELGMIGGLTVLILYIILLFKVLEIARNASNLRGSIIAFGTFGYVITHIFVNLGGILAIIPLTGVPLPFLSYGGSFMINLMILLALTQRVAIETKENKYKKEVKKAVGGR